MANQPSNTTPWWQCSGILIVVALALFVPMAFVQSYILTKAMADFSVHISLAEQMKRGATTPSYVLVLAGWQVLLLSLSSFSGFPFRAANL
ncbi:MAG: hypothetical protein ACP5QU_09395 [Anaerolineae bacterium]